MTRAHNFGVFLRRFAGVPCIATAHSHILQPLTWMFNDHVIAVSDKTRQFQQSRNFVRTANIETVHGFTDYDRQAAVPAGARAAVRSSFGLSEATSVFGVIGDIIPRKGHLHLVRALPEIVRALPDVRMLVVGDPKRKMGQVYYEKVLQEVQRLGVGEHIIWAGYRTDVPDLMSAIDLYVMASLDEMFPVAALEAMAARRPIVATNVGGIPECLTNEVTALLVPPSNPQSLASAITRLLVERDVADRLAERAHDLVRDQFSVQSQTTRIEDVFRRVLARFGSVRTAGGAAGTLP
jgi:glycosyltransferase involved in cell wall biosynthesis